METFKNADSNFKVYDYEINLKVGFVSVTIMSRKYFILITKSSHLCQLILQKVCVVFRILKYFDILASHDDITPSESSQSQI